MRKKELTLSSLGKTPITVLKGEKAKYKLLNLYQNQHHVIKHPAAMDWAIQSANTFPRFHCRILGKKRRNTEGLIPS